MNKIALCCTSLNQNTLQLYEMLNSAVGFDETLLHINKGSREVLLAPPWVKQYFYSDSLTAAQGYNYVITQAKTPWVIPFCDDDFFHVENLKELLAWFHNTNIQEDIVRFPIFGGNERDGWKEWLHPEPSYEGLKERNMLPFACFYRKSLWEKIQGYDDLPFNDWGFWLKAYKVGAKAVTWHKPIYYFRKAIEERLSDKELKAQDFEISRAQLIQRSEEM